MVKIEHELLFAPINVIPPFWLGSLTAEFTDKSGEKVRLPTGSFLTGAWPDSVIRDTDKRAELQNFLNRERVFNPEIRALDKRQWQGARGIHGL